MCFCVSMCVSVYASVCVCLHVSVCIFVCVCVSMYVCLCVWCACVCMFMCVMCIYEHVSMCACVYERERRRGCNGRQTLNMGAHTPLLKFHRETEETEKTASPSCLPSSLLSSFLLHLLQCSKNLSRNELCLPDIFIVVVFSIFLKQQEEKTKTFSTVG